MIDKADMRLTGDSSLVIRIGVANAGSCLGHRGYMEDYRIFLADM